MINEKQWTPFQLMSVMGKGRALKKFYGSKRLQLNNQEADLFSKFYYEVTQMKASSDKSLGTFLKYGRYSPKPIIDTLELLIKEKRLPELRVFYGEKDWMDKEAAMKECKERGLNVNFHVIKDCGHQIVFQNPVEVAKLLVEDLGVEFEPVKPVNLLNEELEIMAPEEEEW